MRVSGRITQDILNASDTRVAVNFITREIKDLGFDRVRLYLYENKDNTLYVAAKSQIGLKDKINVDRFKRLSWPLKEDRAVNKLIKAKTPSILREDLSSRYSILEKEGLNEYALIPIIIGKIVIGHITVDNKYSRAPLKPFYNLFSHISRFSSLALEKVHKFFLSRLTRDAEARKIKKRCARYENFINNMNGFFIAIDTDNFRVVQFNKAAEGVFRIDKKSALGKNIITLFDKGSCLKLKDIIDTTLTSGKITRGEVKCKIGNRNCTIGYNTRLVPDPWQREKHLITITGTDITEYNKVKKELAGERKTLEALVTEQRELIGELEETNRRLKKTDQNKSEFIAAVSHELRNPLTSIKSFTEILMLYKKEKKTNQQEFLAIIKEESDRLGRMIGNLLSLSWTDVAKKRWHWKNLSISELIKKGVQELSEPTKQKEIDVEIDISPDLPLVRAESDQLLEVLTNLLDNAIRFTPQKGRITISASQRNDKIFVSISDTGPGIPAKYLKKIFEPFFRLSSNYKGTGLGLAICRKIIQRHKGNIFAESKLGEGTTFKFYIPVK